ncbi:MAG TPA: glutamate--tRNA ligase family protein [Chthoniobacterales bacterium]|nr:glutamate--tRNA ligase family protein [Chthoniobacterales bacterium]
MTFWRAQERAWKAGGKLVLRIEDLDRDRRRKEFADAISDDLRWFGLEWDEGPDIRGPFAPYVQSERRCYYVWALEKLRVGGFVYPCKCSRKDVMQASLAPHDENEEPIYPRTCRPSNASVAAAASAAKLEELPPKTAAFSADKAAPLAIATHWRFRVPDDERIDFVDKRVGKQSAVAGREFGDFIVWRRDDVPAYQLAVVVDDAAMQISEAVRGEDLLMSTFRQLLLYRALDLRPPKFITHLWFSMDPGNGLRNDIARLACVRCGNSGSVQKNCAGRYPLDAAVADRDGLEQRPRCRFNALARAWLARQ